MAELTPEEIELLEEAKKAKDETKEEEKPEAAEEPEAAEPEADEEPEEAELEVDEEPEETASEPEEDDEDVNSLVAELVKAITNRKAFSRRGAKQMTYKERKAEYGSEVTPKDKLSGAKDSRAKQEVDWVRDEFKSLSYYAEPKTNRIAWVKVTGNEHLPNFGLCLTARLLDKDEYTDKHRGKFKIVIPLAEAIDLDNENIIDKSLPEEKQKQYVEDLLNKMNRLHLQVKILNVDEKEKMAFASRLAASEKLSRHYFGKKKVFHVGDIIQASVMYRRRDRVLMTAYGQDFWIKTEEVTWTAVGPLFNEFEKGEKIYVKILSLEDYKVKPLNREYTLTKMTASIKQAEENPNIRYYDSLNIGDKVNCRVKNMTANGLTFFCLSEGLGILIRCEAPKIGNYGIDDEVLVKVTGKIDKNHWFNGYIIPDE